jgi:twitching motility protein PilT
MRKREVDHFLRKMLDFHENVSDLIVTVDRPFQVESDGELMGVPMDVQLDNLTPFQTEIFALNLLGGDRRNVETLLSEGSCDLSYHLAGKARFRVNVFSQRGYFSVVMRKLELFSAGLFFGGHAQVGNTDSQRRGSQVAGSIQTNGP